MRWSIVSFSNDLIKIFNNFSNCNIFILGGKQNLEWSNIERPIFRNFKITNIEIAKDELFDYFIYEFSFYYYFLKLLEYSKYLTIFPDYKIFCIFSFVKFRKLYHFPNKKITNILNMRNIEWMKNSKIANFGKAKRWFSELKKI